MRYFLNCFAQASFPAVPCLSHTHACILHSALSVRHLPCPSSLAYWQAAFRWSTHQECATRTWKWKTRPLVKIGLQTVQSFNILSCSALDNFYSLNTYNLSASLYALCESVLMKTWETQYYLHFHIGKFICSTDADVFSKWKNLDLKQGQFNYTDYISKLEDRIRATLESDFVPT